MTPNPPIVRGPSGKLLMNPRVDLYVNGDTGNDQFSGLSEALAVKTLERIAEIASGECSADCKWVVVNLRGSITLAEGPNLTFTSLGETNIVLDGGPDLATVLDDGAGNPIVSDINAAGKIGLSTAMWATDQYKGYWAQITGGQLDGTKHIIIGNTATTLTLLETGADNVEDTQTGDYTGCAFTDQGGNVCRLTDASNPFTSDYLVGRTIEVGGATSPGNDGVFTITAVDAAGGWVEYTNAALVAEAFANEYTYGFIAGGGPLPDLGAGTSFKVVRPATEITADPFSWFNLRVDYKGEGFVSYQNLYLSGGAGLAYSGTDDNELKISHLIHRCGDDIFWPGALGGPPWIQFGQQWFDTSVLVPEEVYDSPTEMLGYSVVAKTLAPFTFGSMTSTLSIDSSLIPDLWMYNVGRTFIAASLIESAQLLDCRCPPTAGLTFANLSFGVPTTFGGFRTEPDLITAERPAIIARNSNLALNQPILKDSTWGLELWNSSAMIRTLAGNNNGAGGLGGVYAHGKSVLGILPGSDPSTVTGNTSSVELSDDGASQLSTWVGIETLPISTTECTADYTVPFGSEAPW